MSLTYKNEDDRRAANMAAARKQWQKLVNLQRRFAKRHTDFEAQRARLRWLCLEMLERVQSSEDNDETLGSFFAHAVEAGCLALLLGSDTPPVSSLVYSRGVQNSVWPPTVYMPQCGPAEWEQFPEQRPDLVHWHGYRLYDPARMYPVDVYVWQYIDSDDPKSYPTQVCTDDAAMAKVRKMLIVNFQQWARETDGLQPPVNPSSNVSSDQRTGESRAVGHPSGNLVKPDKAVMRTYTVAELRNLTGLANTALNRYAKTAKVKTPQRGQRNFRYTAADVQTILETIIARKAEERLREKCIAALQDLPEIT